ncbi:DUF11 domain-containing protein [Stackebrandtia nassauensis]|uniref:DUF7927 domain-containing protein n=1 Tax=Stackebrandtia nassauensis (strain DSM 44728 / CIP 108903 / NRRL B-16338 / NBRC 102104 / LLR-40K-21) TaxID=446470 RepID=D3PZQ7_STANL|nr:DUF11 domain-containing protein [Stackebrandtia nassauensis]ADD43594.1 hypothetical protein Snas_3941 [Stackebrandtia nassauensis DSM 44728]
MKLFRHTRLTITAVAVTAIAISTSIGVTGTGADAAITDSGLASRFSADLYGDVTTIGNREPACGHDCAEASSARLRIPEGATVAHARLSWASGLGEACRTDAPTASTRLRVGDAEAATVPGRVTGGDTAEADVTKRLSGLAGGTAVTVEGVRAGDCAAGWSLTVAYELPRGRADGVVKRHVAIYGGALTASESALRLDGFRRFGTAAPRLSATGYGDTRLSVNGTAIAPAGSHITDTPLPEGVIAAGDTSADIGISGAEPLLQQVALSVPVPDVSINATATPQRIGPGDTVVHTITVTNNGDAPVEDASFRVDLSRALDDATRPFDVTASTGESVFKGRSLKWTGTLPAEATATLTYSVTVKNPRPGDGKLESTVIGGTDTNCSAKKPASECFVKLSFPPRPKVDVNDSGTGIFLPVTGAPVGGLFALATVALLGGAALWLASRRPGRAR